MDVSISYNLIRFLNPKDFTKLFLKLRNRYLHKTQRIVVYGVSGVGKTEFLNSILGNNFSNGQRTQDLIEYPFELPDGHKVIFIDTPGHSTMSAVREGLQRDYAKSKISGIINIVSYGYQSTPETAVANVFKAGTNEIKEEFLRDNFKIENSQLLEWERYVKADNHVKWFMTVVNKADLWYDNHDAVMEYYRAGDYYKTIRGIEHCCNIHTFPFCSIMKSFMGKFRSLQYSEVEKKSMHEELISQLQRLACK